MITVIISKAILCLNALQCFPVLVGENTPIGTFTMQHVIVEDYGRREDVLKIQQVNPNLIIAIHRPPSEQRRQMIENEVTKKVTHGCINVSDELFEYLLSEYSGKQITIKE